MRLILLRTCRAGFLVAYLIHLVGDRIWSANPFYHPDISGPTGFLIILVTDWGNEYKTAQEVSMDRRDFVRLIRVAVPSVLPRSQIGLTCFGCRSVYFPPFPAIFAHESLSDTILLNTGGSEGAPSESLQKYPSLSNW